MKQGKVQLQIWIFGLIFTNTNTTNKVYTTLNQKKYVSKCQLMHIYVKANTHFDKIIKRFAKNALICYLQYWLSNICKNI